MPHDEPDDLRRALRDAVADIRPEGTLEQIRSRTHQEDTMAAPTRGGRWILPTLTAAALIAVVIAGAYWLTSDEEKTSPSVTPSPSTATSSPSPSESPGTTSRAVPVYFVGDTPHGQRLYREFQSQQICASDDCLLRASTVTALTGDPADHDYTTPWPSGTGLREVSYDGDVLTIDLTGDLHGRPAGMSEADAGLAIQQLLFSAQAGLGKGRVPVQLLLDGKHTDTVLGVPASEPLAADNPDDVQALVQVDNPLNGSTVSQTFTVSGRAATFEANVVWELTEDGKVVKHGFTTAQECCTLAPYSFQVTAPAGFYTLTVHDTDESGQDLPVNQDTKEITVQ